MADAQKIMRQERERTLSEIDKLPLPPEAREDVLRVCAVIQQALNETLQELNRAIDPRVGPAAMHMMGDEIERLNKRFSEAGLTERLQ